MTIQSELYQTKYCLRATIKENQSNYGNKTTFSRLPATARSRSLHFVPRDGQGVPRVSGCYDP